LRFLKFIVTAIIVQLPSSNVKPPRQAAYDATLAERQAKRWAALIGQVRKKHPIFCSYTILRLPRAAGSCSILSWSGKLRHQLPWWQIHNDAATPRKRACFQSTKNAPRRAFRIYGPRSRCTIRRTVP